MRVRKSRLRLPAFTLVEVVMASLIVGLLLVAALKTIGQATSSQISNGENNRAALIASALVAEIVQLPYADPAGSAGLGPEAGEATGGTRANFDDVDDYNGWSASPPVNKEGTPHANASEFMTSVTVDYVDPDDLTHAVGSEMGVKRIGVTVTKDGRTLASFTTVVTKRS